MRGVLCSILIWIACTWGLAGGLAAEGYPALHDVSGVSANDVLNVRAGPGAKNPVVGTLAPDARDVEVIRVEGNWGLVNTSESTGWASLKFLERQFDGDLPNGQRLGCFGTEPFWGLNIRQGQTAVLNTPDSPVGEVFGVGLFQRAYAPLTKYVLLGEGGGRELAVVVTQAYCDDGMSDREYGYDATVIVSGANGPVLSGCCSLSE